MHGIALWWIGLHAMEERVMQEVRAHVEAAFGVTTTIRSDPDRPPDTLDPIRGQHSSTAILKWLAAVHSAEAGKIVAVTDADLYIPVLTFVFGEAKLGGSVAVVSTARLAASPGEPGGQHVLTARLAKECIHELGHAFGLIHCVDPRCVMARSAAVLHVDAKRGALCRECRIRLTKVQQQGGNDGYGA